MLLLSEPVHFCIIVAAPRDHQSRPAVFTPSSHSLHHSLVLVYSTNFPLPSPFVPDYWIARFVIVFAANFVLF